MAVNRKYGRNKKSPSAARYKGGNVCAINKARKMEKELACANKEMNVPRGTARALRRGNYCPSLGLAFTTQ